MDALNIIRKLKLKDVGVYFEKEDISTLDSKGEFLITPMSSLAEEESRSISENVKWGQRKRFADGRYHMPYKQFLGYIKGANGEPELVEEEAKIIRIIYRLCLEGYSPSAIAAMLTEAKIPTPAGLCIWQRQTIESILQNEKYYGAALLQKKYCVDYRTKTMRKNQGELPMYYVENGHEGIVTKEIFDAVTAYDLNSKNETSIWRTVIEKVIVHPGHLLEFHTINGSKMEYRMIWCNVRGIYCAGETPTRA